MLATVWGHARYCTDTCSARCCCAHAAALPRAGVLDVATPGPGDTRGGTATVWWPHESERAHRWACTQCRIEGHSAHRGGV